MSTNKRSNYLRSKTSTKDQTCDLYIEDADHHQLTPTVHMSVHDASTVITTDCISPDHYGQTFSIGLDLDIWEYRSAILNEHLLRSRLYPNGLQVSERDHPRSEECER